MSAKEGCPIAYHFLFAMASLSAKEEAIVYKGLMSLGRQN